MNQIFSIGGYAFSYLRDCEVYDIKGNTWKALPNLITPRSCCAAVIFRKQWIYAIAGFNGPNLDSVERLSILGNENWCNVNISNMFYPRSMCHGIQISESEVLIAGDDISTKESYRLNLVKNECEHDTDMETGVKCCECLSPVLLDGVAYFVGSYKIHAYTIAERKWKTI